MTDYRTLSIPDVVSNHHVVPTFPVYQQISNHACFHLVFLTNYNFLVLNFKWTYNICFVSPSENVLWQYIFLSSVVFMPTFQLCLLFIQFS